MKRAGLVLIVLLLPGCFGGRYVRTDPGDRVVRTENFNEVSEHVLVISVDGLRPDAIAQFGAETIGRIMREGNYTLAARTILPSKTMPSHTSMLTGQPPAIHGVRWNTAVGFGRKRIETPTVFSVLRDKGYLTAAFFSKPKFSSLQQPGSLDYSQAPRGWFGGWSAEKTTADVVEYLAGEQPSLLFVHFGDADRAGHADGWMSEKYGRAVKTVDDAIAQIVAAAESSFGAGNFTLILTADHGGHERDHGSEDPRDTTIPWIAWGKGVQSGQIQGQVETMDTASTVLWLFGVPEPSDWMGRPVVEAFKSLELTTDN